MKAALHAREAQRLATLDRYEILDTPTEPEFDEIARLVAAICDTPIAVVNFIANGRQWFKSEIGIGVREMPLEPSICAHAILMDDFMVIPDTMKDRRFTDNPLVISEPGLRFYAGALLKADNGMPLGTLCVLDQKPRDLEDHQLTALKTLASHVMHLLEMRRVRQRELRLKDELERTLQAYRRMIDTVSHDLRTPIQTISLSSQILQLKDDPELTDVADRLQRMSRQMTALVDDLQDYEALQSGTLSLQIARVSSGRILADIEDTFALSAGKEGIELNVERSSPDVAVLVDPRRCAQMLGNLVQNAIKFTPRGGHVVVRATATDNTVRFDVEDDGVGIAERDVEKLFEPHWRAATADSVPGSGLGLSIVHKLAIAQDARVAVSSAEGRGSRFSLDLRRA